MGRRGKRRCVQWTYPGGATCFTPIVDFKEAGYRAWGNLLPVAVPGRAVGGRSRAERGNSLTSAPAPIRLVRMERKVDSYLRPRATSAPAPIRLRPDGAQG